MSGHPADDFDRLPWLDDDEDVVTTGGKALLVWGGVASLLVATVFYSAGQNAGMVSARAEITIKLPPPRAAPVKSPPARTVSKPDISFT